MSCRHAQIHHADHAAARLLLHELIHPLTCSTKMSVQQHGKQPISPRPNVTRMLTKKCCGSTCSTPSLHEQSLQSCVPAEEVPR